MILYGTDLVNKIRDEFDNANKRIWIAVPFIGEWSAVKRIMGTKWLTNSNIDIRIITDIRNSDFINPETIKQFLHKGNVKTLDGLHAKIYIIDNSVFITSANLTGTAFSKRYEICQYSTITEKHKIISIFKDWWKIGKKVDVTWKPTARKKSKKEENDAGNINGLKNIWKLPKSPITIKNFKDYQDNIALYNHFKDTYDKINNRILPKLPIYHELDAFLNYLFHDHKNIPSHKYLKDDYRVLSDTLRVSEIRKYKKQYMTWIKNNPNSEDYRKERIKLIQKKLSKNSISKLSRDEVTDIIDRLHTMSSHDLNRFRFLNTKNNSLTDIRNAWSILIHDDRTIEERMEICDSKLNFFGKSSIRELVSWYYPNKYPIMNRNSNAGLKFFGYDINTY